MTWQQQQQDTCAKLVYEAAVWHAVHLRTIFVLLGMPAVLKGRPASSTALVAWLDALLP